MESANRDWKREGTLKDDKDEEWGICNTDDIAGDRSRRYVVLARRNESGE